MVRYKRGARKGQREFPSVTIVVRDIALMEEEGKKTHIFSATRRYAITPLRPIL